MSALRIEWNKQNQKDWQVRLKQVGSYTAYQQDWSYGEAARQFGGQVQRAAILKDDECVGLVQLTARTLMRYAKVVMAMRGPVWIDELSDEDKAQAYRLLRKELEVKWPKLTLWMPESDDHDALRQAKMRKIISGYSTVMIDLDQSQDDLLKAQDGKWRNRLKAAQKGDVKIHNVGLRLQQYAWLLEAEARQSAIRRYAALPPDFVPIYQMGAGKESLLILRAEINKVTVAGVLILLHANSATYHIGWSNDEGRQSGAHNLLLWEAMSKLKSKGIRWFDLGGVNTEDAAGIARFKLGMGGQVMSLSGTYN